MVIHHGYFLSNFIENNKYLFDTANPQFGDGWMKYCIFRILLDNFLVKCLDKILDETRNNEWIFGRIWVDFFRPQCRRDFLWLDLVKWSGWKTKHGINQLLQKLLLEDFLDICLDEFLINIWTIFVTNSATVPESLSVVGGGWMKWMEDKAWHGSIIT